MKHWPLLLVLGLLAGCPKESPQKSEPPDPGPRPTQRAAEPVPMAAGVRPGSLGPEHICWKNPTHTIDAYPLPPQQGSAGQSALDTVVVSWSQTPLPADCEARIENDIGFEACPGWPIGDMWQGTAVPGATLCIDVPLPIGMTYVAATARNAEKKESAWSNVVAYDVPRPPAPPVPPKVLDPVCNVEPKCQRWIGQTLHGYVDTPIVLRWRPSAQFQIEAEVLTWPAPGTRVFIHKNPVNDGTVRWTPKAAGQHYSRARMCQGSECSAWVTSVTPETWVYSIVQLPAVARPHAQADAEENDPQPTADPRAAPSPPIPDTPICRVEPICTQYSGDTVFGYVGVNISLRMAASNYYAFGELRRFETNTLVARRVIPPGSTASGWKPATQGRFWSQAKNCTTNDMTLGQCSDWVGSNTPPLHWQYVIGPLPAGTEVGDDPSGEPMYEPVEECIPDENGDGCEEESSEGVWEEGGEEPAEEGSEV